MEKLELLEQIWDLCVVPLLAVLTAYIVALINKKTKELDKKADNEMAQKYMDMLSKTVTNCVIATNQTYVNALKDKNAFDGEAQKQAFATTLDAVYNILTEEAKTYLSTVYGDLNLYITKLIESEVNQNKQISIDCMKEE